MDSFEFNKIAGAVLGACLGVMIIGKISNAVVHPRIPEKPHIPVTEAAATPGPVDAAPAKAPPATGNDAQAGAAAFKKECGQCHTGEKGGKTLTGPNLFGIVGAKKAHAGSGFAYSSAMTSKGGEWTEEELNEFLFKPQQFVKGTKMGYAGVRNDKTRGDIIAYLKTLKE